MDRLDNYPRLSKEKTLKTLIKGGHCCGEGVSDGSTGIQRGAGHSFYNGTHTAPKSTAKIDILCGDFVKAEIFAEAGRQIEGSLVCIAVCLGGETLTQLAGTIIHSDGIVATCASRLCYLKSKDLKATIDVKVLDTKVTYEGVLLDADFCSKVAFIKIMSPEQQQVARFVKLDYHYPQSMAVAVGCTADRCVFPHAEPYYCLGFISSIANEIENEQIDARTSGRVIKAELKDKGIVIGGPLVDSNFGVSGVIHYEDSFGIKVTPIHDVLKCLELFKKQQFCNLNRTKFILGFSIFLGLSVLQYFKEYTAIKGYGPVHTSGRWFNDMVNVPFSSESFVTGLLAYFLDNTIHKRDGSIRKDCGKHWWDKFRYYNTDTRSEEFYSLPLNLNKHFPSV